MNSPPVSGKREQLQNSYCGSASPKFLPGRKTLKIFPRFIHQMVVFVPPLSPGLIAYKNIPGLFFTLTRRGDTSIHDTRTESPTSTCLPLTQNLEWVTFSSVQSFSRVQLFVTPWTAACQAYLSIINSWSYRHHQISSVPPWDWNTQFLLWDYIFVRVFKSLTLSTGCTCTRCPRWLHFCSLKC